MQKFRTENERLRAENRALTRVVSKLTTSAQHQLSNNKAWVPDNVDTKPSTCKTNHNQKKKKNVMSTPITISGNYDQ